MAGGRMYDSTSICSAGVNGGGDGPSDLSVLIRGQKGSCSSQPLDASFLSASSASPFLGSRSIVSFEDVHRANGSTRPFFRAFDHDENGDDDLDEYFHQPEKKRRLTVEQVQFLEKSFEVENKLEPERKIQLAKDLGLQPRQVAIWFQNRRARWKTKQLEKDYDVLQASYNKLKSDYENLLKEKEKLKDEVLHLTDKLHLQEKGGKNPELPAAMNNAIITLSQEPPLQNPISESVSEGEVSNKINNNPILPCKQEDISSAKSDIFDSDSPRPADGVHSSLLEPGDSSYVFEPEQSDLSQDEEDELSKNLLHSYIFPKLEETDYYSGPPANTSNFGFPIEDHNAIWSWSY